VHSEIAANSVYFAGNDAGSEGISAQRVRTEEPVPRSSVTQRYTTRLVRAPAPDFQSSSPKTR